MERRTNPYAPEIIHNFLQDAQKDGAIKRFRESKSRRCQKPYFNPISRQLNTIAIVSGTLLYQSEIARMKHITPQAVNRVIRRGFAGIWQNGTPELQTKYPLSSLKIYKQKQVNTYRATVEAQKENASRKESRQKQQNANRVITRVIEKSVDKELIQKALDILPLYFAEKLARNENGPFISFYQTLKHSPQWKAEKTFDELKKAGIPVIRILRGKTEQNAPIVNYYVVKRFKNRAIEHLAQSPLKDDTKSKVEQISGPTSTSIPSTYEFARLTTHKKVRSLIPDVWPKNLKGISYGEIYADCPVPIFQYRTKDRTMYIFPKEKEPEVKEYLKKRLEELGIKPSSSH